MDTLVRYGFTIEEIKNMMDSNQDIEKTSDKIISELIIILEDNNCNKKTIKNIFTTNPFYLNNNPIIVKEMINELDIIGIKYKNILFDSNPYILNLTKEEIIKLYKNIDLPKNELINYFYYNTSKII